MSANEPIVTVGTVTRHYLKCEVCNLTPMLFGDGYATEGEAREAARKHREAHAAQPYCTCGTYPNLSWDDDESEPGVGHEHCRHHGRCCECGCLTKRTCPTPPGASDE